LGTDAKKENQHESLKPILTSWHDGVDDIALGLQSATNANSYSTNVYIFADTDRDTSTSDAYLYTFAYCYSSATDGYVYLHADKHTYADSCSNQNSQTSASPVAW
jgi:hypothetical protein